VHFECERYQIVQVGPDGPGGGWLVIGKILLLHVDESILTNGKVDYERFHPVGRLGGMEYANIRDRFVMPRKKYVPGS
jgi:flavin reductase (DIM6/NTAB) family NADH-FMN oxidoreductase RutF